MNDLEREGFLEQLREAKKLCGLANYGGQYAGSTLGLPFTLKAAELVLGKALTVIEQDAKELTRLEEIISPTYCCKFAESSRGWQHNNTCQNYVLMY